MMRSIFKTALMLAVALGMASVSQASFYVTVSDSASGQSQNFSIQNPTGTISGTYTFTESFGTATVTFKAQTDQPGAGGFGQVSQVVADVILTNTDTKAKHTDQVTVSVNSSPFIDPTTGPAFGSSSGHYVVGPNLDVTTTGTGKKKTTTYSDYANFSSTIAGNQFGPQTGGAFDPTHSAYLTALGGNPDVKDQHGITIGSSPYAITNTMVINIIAAAATVKGKITTPGSTEIDASGQTTVNGTALTPEPSSMVLALLASPLGLGYWIRRRKAGAVNV